MSAIVDRLKESSERAAEEGMLPVDLMLTPEGVRVSCRVETDDAIITHQICVGWLVIEQARFNPVTQAVTRVRRQIYERMKS